MPSESNPVGRPTKYKPEYVMQVEKLCKLGATDEEIANFFEIDVSTVNEWKIVHPEFSESIKSGKHLADANVASSLYHRATGYSHEDVDIKMYEGDIIETKLIKHYPPDPTSMIFWLKNRQPSKWRDKTESDNKTTIKDDRIDPSKLTDDELRLLAELQRKSGTSQA